MPKRIRRPIPDGQFNEIFFARLKRNCDRALLALWVFTAITLPATRLTQTRLAPPAAQPVLTA